MFLGISGHQVNADTFAVSHGNSRIGNGEASDDLSLEILADPTSLGYLVFSTGHLSQKILQYRGRPSVGLEDVLNRRSSLVTRSWVLWRGSAIANRARPSCICPILLISIEPAIPDKFVGPNKEWPRPGEDEAMGVHKGFSSAKRSP